MVHALVMVFGWWEYVIVVFDTRLGLMARVRALEERKISQEYFAIPLFHYHNNYHTPSVMAWTN